MIFNKDLILKHLIQNCMFLFIQYLYSTSLFIIDITSPHLDRYNTTLWTKIKTFYACFVEETFLEDFLAIFSEAIASELLENLEEIFSMVLDLRVSTSSKGLVNHNGRPKKTSPRKACD